MEQKTKSADEIYLFMEELQFSHKTNEWKKFIGDSFAFMVKKYIGEELTKEYKIVGPNVYISGIPVEYDLKIVEAEAEKVKDTDA